MLFFRKGYFLQDLNPLLIPLRDPRKYGQFGPVLREIILSYGLDFSIVIRETTKAKEILEKIDESIWTWLNDLEEYGFITIAQYEQDPYFQVCLSELCHRFFLSIHAIQTHYPWIAGDFLSITADKTQREDNGLWGFYYYALTEDSLDKSYPIIR